MRLKFLVILCLILSLTGVVLAEEISEEAPPIQNSEIKLYLPDIFKGTTVSLTDSVGNLISEVVVDETGQGSITLPATPESFSLKAAGVIEANESEEEGLTLETLLPGILLAFPIVALIFYVIGRLSLVKVLKELKEAVYDETLD